LSLFGFELLVAPYTMAHMKLDLLLKEHGYQFESNQRLGIYLTNALESLPEGQYHMGFEQFIATEGAGADQVKREQPVMVVLGNPPYSNFGMLNKSDWIRELLEDYKKGLKEKKINLDDDFIKFIRFGQWRIERTGAGILAFITSNTYLDGITHRRMRQSLMETFTDIYILNLHGNSRKKEHAPDGSPDENVFDIQQGVAIGIFIKQGEQPQQQATVYYADLWGEREDKYAWLLESNVFITEWESIQPHGDQFFLVPRDFELQEEYKTLYSVSLDVYIQHNTGIQTKRDSFVYHITQEELQGTLTDIRSLDSKEIAQKYGLPPDGRDWTINAAQTDVVSNEGEIVQVTYHPFDKRWTYYTGKTKGFIAYPRQPLMLTTIRVNISLLVVRNSRRGNVNNFFAVDTPVDKDGVSPFDNATFCPLYLYPTPQEVESGLYAADERRPNLSVDFINDITHRLGLEFKQDGSGDLTKSVGPEDIFHYIYAVFHSPTYRQRYAEFLKIDFPRVPLTSDRVLFAALAAKGAELVDLHLLRLPGTAGVGGAGGTAILQNPQQQGVLAPAQGDNQVEKVRYVEPQGDQPGRVYFNKEQFFAGIEPETWAMQIGGYQPLEKWLKDRKGRTLGIDDIQHYRRVVVALRETRRLMGEIDGLIPGWPLA
jgi:predicted helicase